jgi:hypothetical protein
LILSKKKLAETIQLVDTLQKTLKDKEDELDRSKCSTLQNSTQAEVVKETPIIETTPITSSEQEVPEKVQRHSSQAKLYKS